MKQSFHSLPSAYRRRLSHRSALLLALVASAFVAPVSAQAPAAPVAATAAPAANAMDDLVGRIALYPDDLVAVILPASTSPLQIVQADRWLDKRKADPKLPIDDKWDDAVKTLLNYPEVVKMMSNDLDWTSALGEAVVADQGAVLDGVQSFRRRAQAAGNLKSDDKQVVKAEKEIIIIQPANPEVIYVPQYTPSTVVTYGVAPVYGYYPAPYPSYYYPYAPGAALAAGVIWGAAIGAAWNGGHWGADYDGGDINIDVDRNTNIDRNTKSIAATVGDRAQRGGAAPVRQGSTAWKSNKQPGQVSSSVGKSPLRRRASATRAAARVRAASVRRALAVPGRPRNLGVARRAPVRAHRRSPAAAQRVAVRPGPRPSLAVAGSAGASRPGTQPSGGYGGSSASRGGDAFSGYSSGRQTQMDSSRGASSRSSMSGGGAPPGAQRWRCTRRWWRPRRRRSSLNTRATSMHTSAFHPSQDSTMNLIHLWAWLRRLALALALALPLAATAAPQQTFATPEAAVDALMAAFKADSDASTAGDLRRRVQGPDRAGRPRRGQRQPRQDLRVDADAARVARVGPRPAHAADRRRGLAAADPDRAQSAIAGASPANRATTRSSTAASAPTNAMPSMCCARSSTRSAPTRRSTATATACGSTRRSWPARRASKTACTGPPTPPRAKRSAPSAR